MSIIFPRTTGVTTRDSVKAIETGEYTALTVRTMGGKENSCRPVPVVVNLT